MAFSSSGTPMSMKEHSLGVSIGPGATVGVSSAGYTTFSPASHDFQGTVEFSQQQREYLAQRNMLSQAAEQQHSQGRGQGGGHSQGQHITMNEGAKVSTVSTHDFLSLYADNSNQYAEHHDNMRGLSSALTTKDFLQPLETRGNHAAFREGQPSRGEKHPRQQEGLPHGSTPTPPAVAERLLSTGMNVYNGGHGVPNYGRVNKGAIDLPGNAMVRMVGEGNVEMRGRGGFNPSAGSMVTREDHDARNDLPKDQDPAPRGDNLAYWSNVRMKFGMLPPELNYHPQPNQPTSHGVMDNVQQPPVPNMPKQWPQGVQGVIDMTKRPTRVLSEDDEDDEEEYGDRPRENRSKEPLSKADPAQKVDGKVPENRGGTPRSKHSATEQRRRSKINDRFQMLRELVPHSDQKRDKASFLLEVIEYIQVLQDKVRKFETAEQGRHQDRLKNMVWDLCKRGGSGPGDTSIEASCMDALAYAKEFVPSSAGLPIDVKQVTEASEVVRQRAVSSADENGSTELSHNPQHTHKSGHHGASSSHEEKEGAAVLGKSPLSSQQHQGQTPFSSRNLPHASQVKQLSAASDAQANVAGEGQVQNSSTIAPATGAYEQHDKANEVEPSQQTRTQASTQQSQGEGDTSEQQHPDSRHRHGTSTAEDTGNGHAASFTDDQSNTKPHLKLDRQHGYGSSPRSTHNSQATDNSQANWQGQQHGSSAENSQQKEESRGATTSAQGQDPLTIQGGVINVSSVYSQGLLDTLTRALQSSGLDLSQANISVQIDLGKSISSAALPPSTPKVSGQPAESSGQRHQQQSESHARQQGGSSTDPEHPPLKRPKLEMEL
ncbi:hypothetical protein Mapa_001481 [Marchantia paleacea]|nr:hypothetical protein Mapa_001481 [Marchantia paleacea]